VSLDIAILGADGSPKQQVSIGVDDHHRLMQLVGEDAGLLKRLHNYYADAEFQNTELDALAQELTVLCARCHADGRLVSFLDDLIGLVGLAKREQQPLLAIAD
jgi:hypothetical protein